MRKFSAEHIERKRIAATGKKYPNRRRMTEEEKAARRAKYALKHPRSPIVKVVRSKSSKPKRIRKIQTEPMAGFTIRASKLPPPTTEVSLCEQCSRFYLPQLGCIFCRVYDVNAKKLIYK